MFHDFDSALVEPGKWRHTCRHCRAVFEKPSPTYLRLCDGISELPKAAVPLTWQQKLWQRLPRPGDTLKALIMASTNGQASHGLECEVRRQRMNARGWVACWKDRRGILNMIREQAAKQGYRSDWPALIGRTALAVWRLTALRLVRKWPAVDGGGT